MWYYYLAYKLYCFYRGPRHEIPVSSSFLALSTLIMLNIISVAGIVHMFVPILPKDSKLVVLPLIFTISLFHYLILYRNKKYEDIFHDFDMNDECKKWDKSVSFFIVATITFTISTLIIADLRNHGYLQFGVPI